MMAAVQADCNGAEKSSGVEKTSENKDEQQYLDLISRILKDGRSKDDRTGVGTISIFGAQMRFDLRTGYFPLLTTKRVFFRGVLEELLWFIRGSTDAKELTEKKVHIWDANGSREFLDGLGFTDRPVGDLGPVYGFQWRHAGAQYRGLGVDYSGEGIDQLGEAIRKIRESPNDRRMLMCAWNVADIPKMALPPCHLLAQFYVVDNELSCLVYQRSCDVGLGLPFNIASYALLTTMMAQVTGRSLGDLIITTGDTHIYTNHVDALSEQLTRKPREFPKLKIKRKVDEIDDFKVEDFELVGYNPYGKIEMKMAV